MKGGQTLQVISHTGVVPIIQWQNHCPLTIRYPAGRWGLEATLCHLANPHCQHAHILPLPFLQYPLTLPYQPQLLKSIRPRRAGGLPLV